MARRPVKPEDILSATTTVNEEVLDRAIRHAHYLERLKSHEVNEIVGFLNDDVLPDALTHLRARLENAAARGFDAGPATSKRLKNAIAGTNEIMQKGMQEAGGTLRKDLRGIARTEAEWQARALGKATGALEFSFDLPNVAELNSILTSRPYQGAVFNDWWKNVSKRAQGIIETQVGIGIAEGETVDQMIRRLKGTVGARFKDGALEKVRHNVAATVRTATNHVTTQAREMTFEENEDLIKGAQYVATLDGRTTVICMSLDGQVFDVGEGPRPPQHYQCRSTTVPVLKSLEEIGLPKLKKALPEGTRATKYLRGQLQKSMNGQVPDRQTYGEWFKKQSKTVQNDALGPARAKLFRAGKVTIDRFVDTRGRPLTLEQLRKREGLKVTKPVEAIRRSVGGVESPAHNAWMESLSGSERGNIDDWTQSPTEFREAQIGETIHDTVTTEKWKKNARDLTQTLRRAPEYHGVVHRGLANLDADTFKEFATSKEVTLKALVSSSKSRAVAEEFLLGERSVLLKLNQRSGTDISPFFPDQKEIVLFKGTKFSVVNRSWFRFRDPVFGMQNALEITLEEIL